MNSEIENKIKKCFTCLTFPNHQPNESIINHPIPNQAWTKIAADPFLLYRHYYSIIIYWSIIIPNLLSLKRWSSSVINICKKILSQFGTLKELVTDNGP